MRGIYFILLWLLVLLFVNCQQRFMQNCDEAPTPEAKQVCFMLQRMARNSSRHRPNKPVHRIPSPPEFLRPAPIQPNARGQIASHPYDCMTITCLCPFFRGSLGPENQCILPNGQLLTMAYRKEYRMLSEDERLRYHYTLQILKQSGEYDRMTYEHQSVGQGSGAHSGPGFLPWHREFLKRFEIAIRLIDPTVSIPYWDSVLDSYLPDPKDSIFFTPLFMGENDEFGNVVTGPFAYWSTIDGRPAILRSLGEKGKLFTEYDIADILAQTQIEQIMAYTAPLNDCPYQPMFTALEYTHSFVHLWVGGHMEPPEQSSNDPIFYSLHSFVDLIWELWRQNHQSRWARETQYSQDIEQCSDPQHFSYANMRPFNLINRDESTCSSPYLFCDSRIIPHCVSKIRFGGVCSGFEGLDACFNSVCVMGRCVAGTPPTVPFVPQSQMPVVQRTQIKQQHAVRIFVNCFNQEPCCEQWAREGNCQSRKTEILKICSAACGKCRPAYNISDECTDRHVSCKQWKSEGRCSRNPDNFIAENCRSSCQLCAVKKNLQCQKFKTVSFSFLQKC
ncbi:unnamed protein product [Thelazia callipaeda]|uniref:ShTK domain protein n=1 Tax=Thelazia callipaeda TaxID=103827 RepID=A0A0N5CNE5_THECL|nr:unnamed protein product [Thelazia callipaeda]